MATINYNGMKLEEFTSDKPVIFDPPKKMLVTDDYDYKSCRVTEIIVYDPRRTVCKAIGIHNQSWKYCFLLPDPPKPRRATNRELARWLAQGNGEYTNPKSDYYNNYSSFSYEECDKDNEIYANFKVRKWDDTEWHEPTVDYMGLEEVK
jgi:hypothetical protein